MGPRRSRYGGSHGGTVQKEEHPAKEKPPGEGLKSQGAVPRLPELSREHKLEREAGIASDMSAVGNPATWKWDSKVSGGKRIVSAFNVLAARELDMNDNLRIRSRIDVKLIQSDSFAHDSHSSA